MPTTQIVFYREKDGHSPVIEWLRELDRTNAKAHDKCYAAIARLALLGHELRRPEADYLHDGIYELRVRSGSVNYRILYFFHDRIVSVMAHAVTKEAAVAATDINRALARKAAFLSNPSLHSFTGEITDV